jgi:hypothetical protein
MVLIESMSVKRNLCHLVAAISLSIGLSDCVLGKNANPKVERIDTAETEEMVNKLSHQPELICIRYLHYFLGRPEDSPANRFNPTKHYLWYRPNHSGVKYELVQEEVQPGLVTESTLVFNTDDLDLDLQKVESKFGKAPRKYFDQASSPTLEYSFAPNTVISFNQRANTFQVGRIAINYKGDPLPPPSLEDMSRAQLQRKGLAMDHINHGRYRQGIAVLSEHLGESPDDVEAHLARAQAFKANCQINEAIAQYRYTLANSGNNPTVQSQCIKDLQDMKVLPSVTADSELQQHNVNLKHKGQRLRRGGLASSKKMPKPGDDPADPLNVQPLDPKAALTPVIGEPPVAPAFQSGTSDLSPAPLPGGAGTGSSSPALSPQPAARTSGEPF